MKAWDGRPTLQRVLSVFAMALAACLMVYLAWGFRPRPDTTASSDRYRELLATFRPPSAFVLVHETEDRSPDSITIGRKWRYRGQDGVCDLIGPLMAEWLGHPVTVEESFSSRCIVEGRRDGLEVDLFEDACFGTSDLPGDQCIVFHVYG